MDNRLFSVNGRGKQMLIDTIRLAMFQSDGCYENAANKPRAKGWRFSQKHGLIIYWAADRAGVQKFLTPIGPEALAETALEWLQSDEAKTVEFAQWEDDCDHDGHNSMGWRVYCEDWGHVDGDWGAMFAIKPCYLWHGK